MSLKKLYLICFSILSIASINAQMKYAKIVVYRNENTGEKAEEVYKIYADDNPTTGLRNNHYEEFYMPEGSFKLKVNDILSTSTKVECTSGNTYYFRISQDLSLQNNPITITAIDSTLANNEMKFIKKPEVKKREAYIAQQNRIGMFMEPGIGLNKVSLIRTDTGTDAMFSFGGLGTIGLSYNYLFSDNFGWSVELQDQFSTLIPYLSNANVYFNSGIVSTTPYFTIPIIKRFDQKIKIGAGLDYHFNPKLTIETEKLTDGFNDEWEYNNTFGYHIILFFDMRLGKNLRGHTGLKYNDVYYSFASGKTFQPGIADLKNPHGNSLAASLGLEYCF